MQSSAYLGTCLLQRRNERNDCNCPPQKFRINGAAVPPYPCFHFSAHDVVEQFRKYKQIVSLPPSLSLSLPLFFSLSFSATHFFLLLFSLLLFSKITFEDASALQWHASRVIYFGVTPLSRHDLASPRPSRHIGVSLDPIRVQKQTMVLKLTFFLFLLKSEDQFSL